MQLKLDMLCHLLNVYTKFQIDISKHVEEKSRKPGPTDGRMDGRTDGHCHGIIRPFYKRAYKKLEIINPESQEYLNAKHNLKVYNGILNRNIRLAKKGYYARQFEKYRCDIRKTWDTLKNIINEFKWKSVYPNTFFFDGRQVNNITTIAKKIQRIFYCHRLRSGGRNWYKRQAHFQFLSSKCLGYQLYIYIYQQRWSAHSDQRS